MRKLIAGPSVYICDECVEICSEIIQEEMEEEYARMSRQREELLAAGKVKEARDIDLRLQELEDLMGDYY